MFRSAIFVLCYLLFLQLPCYAQSPAFSISVAASEVAVEQDHVPLTTRILWHRTKVDLGYVPLNEARQETFTFTNTGSVPLQITDVTFTQGQGNVKAFFPAHTLQPGEQGELRLLIRVERAGSLNCFLTVTSNSRSYADVLYITGIGY